MDEVKRLVKIHAVMGGSGPGRRYNLEVLNKSGIVLLVACWESYVEDLASASYEFLLANAEDHSVFPADVLTLASKRLKDHEDNREVWKLAGDGWKQVLDDYKSDLIAEHIGKLNTPRPAQVDNLYKRLLGISRISSSWCWPGMKADSAASKLNRLVTLRGSIAHRVAAAQAVKKATVNDYMWFLYRLAVISTNVARRHLRNQVGKYPWGSYKFRGTS